MTVDKIDRPVRAEQVCARETDKIRTESRTMEQILAMEVRPARPPELRLTQPCLRCKVGQ
jgi:hypothetical protein